MGRGFPWPERRLAVARGSFAWVRRGVLAASLLAVAFVPYPAAGTASAPLAAPCAGACRASSQGKVLWKSPLPGQWTTSSGLAGTVPVSGQAYVAVGDGVAVVGLGLHLNAYSSRTGALRWSAELPGFPADAAVVSVRAWPGVVTAGVVYGPGARSRTEVMISGSSGSQIRRYAAAPFGGAVAVTQQTAVIVGTTAVTGYDNLTGVVRWRRPTGPAEQAWQTDGPYLYVTMATGGYLGSQPVTALRRIDMRTGAESTVRPSGRSFTGALGGAADGVVLFSGASGVTAYNGMTGLRLWSLAGAVPEGTDPGRGRFYLTEGTTLLGVDPLTGHIMARASGSAVAGSAGMYAVRDGVALGLDQGPNGEAWGYDVSAQRVIWTAPGLPWPHYFVDVGGIGGSADPNGPTVILAACAKLAPSPAPGPSDSAAPTAPAGTVTPGATSAPGGTAAPGASTGAGGTPTASGAPASGAPAGSASAEPAPSPSGQGCQDPELVAISR
jgi:hypothetical protein